jgi:hypothetical protein
VTNHKDWGDNYDHIFKRTPIHNGVGEADMYSDEEYQELLNPNPTTTTTMLDNQYEDTTRYTAPPDTDEIEYLPVKYNGFEIAHYVQSCLPDGLTKGYTTEEIREHLQTAIAMIDDEEVGIWNNC